MTARLILFNLLNLADCILTIVLTDRGGYELNPVMRELLYISPCLFVTVKMTIGVALSAWVNRERDKLALRASGIMLGVVACVVLHNTLVMFIQR